MAKNRRVLITNDTNQGFIFPGDKDTDPTVEVPPGESEHDFDAVAPVRALLDAHPQVRIRELAA